MRYSLLSRFQGALLGVALGDRLGFEYPVQQQLQQKVALTGNLLMLNRAALPKQQPDHNLQTQEIQPVLAASSSGRLAVYYAEKLIRQGGWHTPKGEEAPVLSPKIYSKSQLNRETAALGAELAVAILPIALFFHDDEVKLRQTIGEALMEQGHSELLYGALAIGFAIAQAIKERLDPLHLIPQIITYLQEDTSTDAYIDLINKLEQGQTLLQERHNLHTALRTLLPSNCFGVGNGEIVLALFCFLSTPEDMHLAMLRAARCGSASQIVSTLTGALSGAYNSSAGIFLEWELIAADPAQILDGQISTSEICQLAAHLLAVWLGAYDPATASISLAIAAPGVIRPR
jgi:ADP-ribosylglycohydrolase